MFSILYVDDEPGLLEIGKLFLEEGGQFRVETLTSASEALEILSREQYDAIISDYQMPVMDGIEFLKRVRSSGNTVPFIIFTGRGREEIVIQALNEGADFYLQKGGEPVSQFTELAHKIRQAVLQRRAEASIRDHERREADIINFLPDATFAIDTKGIVIAWNRAMEKMTGVPASEVRGKGNYEYAMPFYHEHRPLLIDLVLRDDPEAVARYPYIKRDNKTLFSEITIPYFNEGRGAVLWFTASPLYDTGGTVVGAIESIREITEWKKAEAALNESERRFRELADLLPQGIYEADADGRMTYVNRFALEMSGYTGEDIQRGLNAMSVIAPVDRERAVTVFRHMLERGTRLQGSAEYLAQRKDGSTFPVSIYSSPVLRDGKISGVRGIIIDITDRKRTDERNRNSEQNYRLLFENAMEGILIAQGDRLVNVNPALISLLGRPAEVITSRPFTDFIHPDDREMVMSRHLQRMRGEVPFTGYMFRIITGDGYEKWVWINSTRMTWSGKPASLSFITDMTERKTAEDRLVAAGKEYANLLDQVQDVYYRTDADGRLIRASRSWATLLGYEDISECLGRSIADDFYLNPADRKIFVEEISREGKVTGYEVLLKKKDGTPVLVSTSSHVNTDVSGNVLGIEGIFRDITEKKRIEKALSESEQRYRNIVEDQTEFICRFRPDGTHVFANEAYCRYFSLKREEIIGHRFRPEIPFEDQKSVSRFFASLTPAHPVDTIVHRIVMPDGRICWQRWSVRAIFDTSGQVIEYQSVGRDITQTKETERALRESERQFRLLAENSQDIIDRHSPDGRYTYVSPAINALCGYDPEELIGHSVTELLHPDDISVFAEYQKNLCRENPAAVVSYRIRHKDGHVVWAETVFRGIYDDGTGDLLEICGITRDITKLKETEEKLRRTTEDLDSRNRLFATLLDTVPIGIFMVEAPSGKPILANREATQLLGRGVLPDATADNLALVYEVYKAGTTCRFPTEEMPVVRGMHGESSRVDDMVVVRPDGSTVQLEVFGTPITNSQGGVVGSLVSFLDITERKRSEQVITEAHSKINLLTSITRHDVANQITVLRGLTKIALMKKPDSVVTGLLEKIDAAVSLIARQIEFTRAYQELGVHAPGWHRVRDIMAQQKTDGVTLSCTCDAEVFADPMLERVFFNLIDNAVRHGEKVTAITISCRQDQDTSLVITVEDNGCGVPPELKETIFGKGYGKHTGFGLFLAREVLAITGITIRESGTHGKGARFEMVVPKGMYRAAS
ncbi:MAG: PAS domain S-box protein [Methanoregula sp.]|nr:PAS domain S-box protein [Methanoregula sp.]